MQAPEPVQGYCVKCKEKRMMQNPQRVEMKTKGAPRPAMKGTCETCGTGMFKILPKGA